MNKQGLQPFIGILALDTSFPRIRGDVGCPDSYPFLSKVVIVNGADSPAIVRDGEPDGALLERFIAAAIELERNGACAIVSTCGFLVSAQRKIADAVKIPVMLSGLSLYPLVAASCPGRVGILTASRKALGPNALAAAGIDPKQVAIAGMDDASVFAETFLATKQRQNKSFDRDSMERAVCNAALDLQKSEPDLSAILLECGNLPPYAPAIRKVTGLPVFHLLDAAALLMAANAKD
ncbi:aspartate/glutamate racemase family protein [Ciceribacter sp. RN22]|uniref:aspartate/glutamate racemase family protein n=1 Tax=Ciceribacter sp. RN22 TaxID=2954932 RepID=UPI0020934395|nr:aspartate/glutamate racemase family protein [Ciceribacter sp. RN22]MCO6179642.1 aspartate/glutamate racemase family protein [Ciceribacter sp. RN22]